MTSQLLSRSSVPPRHIFDFFLTFFIFVLSCCFAGCEPEECIVVQDPSKPSQGETLTAAWPNSFSDPGGSHEEAAELACEMGINEITLAFYIFTDSLNPSRVQIYSDPANPTACSTCTASDASLDEFIRYLRNKGFRVRVIPYLDLGNWCKNPSQLWRGFISPDKNNSGPFFDSWTQVLVHYAALAQAAGAQEFFVGMEMAALSTDLDALPYWEDLVDSVRSVFSGDVGYGLTAPNDVSKSAMDWSELGKVSKSFTDLFDVIGVDLWAHLSSAALPSTGVLADGYVEMWNLIDQELQRLGNPRMLFTEIGAVNEVSCAKHPEWVDLAASVSPQCQANNVEAIFETFYGVVHMNLFQDILQHTCTGDCSPPPGTNDDRYALAAQAQDIVKSFTGK